MKWSELTWKERKQIYDAVRAENPKVSYLDIKSSFDNIPEYEEGAESEIIASYSLPEVNVYPENKFGDIARTQGYNTAKAWKEVKEGTTAGINRFANDPRTQFVTGILPMPGGIEGLDEISGLLKTSKNVAKNSNTGAVAKSVIDVGKDLKNIVGAAISGNSLRDMFGTSFSARRDYLTKAYEIANTASDNVKIINNVADKNYRKYMLDNEHIIHFTDEYDRNAKIPIKIHGKNSDKIIGKGYSGEYTNESQKIAIRGLNGKYLKYRTPLGRIGSTAAHETQHWAEDFIADGKVSKYDEIAEYYVPNENNWIGKAFKNVLSGKPGDWIYSPAEVLADRAALMNALHAPISTNKKVTDTLLQRFNIAKDKKEEFLEILRKLDAMQFPEGKIKVKKTINEPKQKLPSFSFGKENELNNLDNYGIPTDVEALINYYTNNN